MTILIDRLKSKLENQFRRGLGFFKSDNVMNQVRTEYTVMPRFQFHQPLDYHADTTPPEFGKPLKLENEELLVPNTGDRFGYSENDANHYLAWGKYDHDLIKDQINRHCQTEKKVHPGNWYPRIEKGV
jgi:hypothetical protein